MNERSAGRPRWRRRGPEVVALAVVLAAVGAPALASGTALAGSTAPAALRLTSVGAGGRPELVVVAPASIAAMGIPASAFRVRQQGRVLRVSVQRIVDEGLEVHVVLDTSASNTALLFQQSAAADLVRALPNQVPTATETSGGLVHAPQVGRSAALAALAAVRSDPAATSFETATTLSSIAGAPAGAGGRTIVLFTNCRADTAPGFPTLSSLLDQHQQVLDVVAAGGACPSALADQARRSGGIALSGITPERLAAAVDTVSADILGQYRLSVVDPVNSSPLVVDLDYGGVHASTSTRLAVGGPPAPSDRAAGRNTAATLLAALSGQILLATGVGLVAALRRRRGPVSA